MTGISTQYNPVLSRLFTRREFTLTCFSISPDICIIIIIKAVFEKPISNRVETKKLMIIGFYGKEPVTAGNRKVKHIWTGFNTLGFFSR